LIAADVAAVGDEFVAAESVVLDMLRDEAPSIRRLKEAREESAAQIAALRKRVAPRG
jgi:hypothetical protein